MQVFTVIPAQAGIEGLQPVAWTPAFASVTVFLTDASKLRLAVIPAQAGIQGFTANVLDTGFAGVTLTGPRVSKSLPSFRRKPEARVFACIKLDRPFPSRPKSRRYAPRHA